MWHASNERISYLILHPLSFILWLSCPFSARNIDLIIKVAELQGTRVAELKNYKLCNSATLKL